MELCDFDADVMKKVVASINGQLDALRKGAKPGQNLAAIQAVAEEYIDCALSIFDECDMSPSVVAHYAIPIFDHLLLYRQERYADLVVAVVLAYGHTPMPRAITARFGAWDAFINGQKARAEAVIETPIAPPAIAVDSAAGGPTQAEWNDGAGIDADVPHTDKKPKGHRVVGQTARQRAIAAAGALTVKAVVETPAVEAEKPAAKPKTTKPRVKPTVVAETVEVPAIKKPAAKPRAKVKVLEAA